jgi:hypothetical protein
MPEEKKKEIKANKAKESREKAEQSDSADDASARLAKVNNLLLNSIWEHQRPKNAVMDSFAKNLTAAALVAALASRAKLRPQLGELESEISKLKEEINEAAHALLEQRMTPS